MKKLHYLLLFLALAAIDCTGGNKTSKSIDNLKHKKCSSLNSTIDSNKYVDVDKKDRRGYTPLYNAVRSNDINKARLLLKSGADPNIAMLYGSILEKAVSKKNVEMVRLLLSYGAYITVREDGSSTILDCFRHKSDDRSKEIYQLLFNSLSPEKRDRVNKKSKEDEELKQGKEDEGDKLLKQATEDVNSLDSMGYTPLHWAVVDNNIKEAKRLLGLGADPNINNQKDDLLYSSVLKQNVEMVRLLLSHGTKVVFEENGYSKVLNSLRSKKDNTSKEIYQLLISNLSNQQKSQYVNSVDGIGYTPLYWAVTNNHLEEVKKLLELGSNPNVVVNGNSTLLYISVQNQNKEMVRLLLSYGAEVYCCDEKTNPVSMAYDIELMNINL